MQPDLTDAEIDIVSRLQIAGTNAPTSATAGLIREAASLITALRERVREAGWRTFDTAPRDGSYILALVSEPSERFAHLKGRSFVIRHEGVTPSGFDLGWAVFPGFSSSKDWFSHWHPLPALLTGGGDE